MSPEEKFIDGIRNLLIEKYGEEFLTLSEEDQNELILKEIRKCIDLLKSETT